MVLECFLGGLLYRRIILCLYVSIILFSDRLLVNYVFNLNHENGAQPNISNPYPWPEGDAPNFDLTVRLSSMLGGLEGDAFTNVLDLDPQGGLVGNLTHLKETKSYEVSDKIKDLLQQPTASVYFDRFSAVESIMDNFDDIMIENFPQVENDLSVPMELVVPCFEEYVKQELDKGKSGLSIIPLP